MAQELKISREQARRRQLRIARLVMQKPREVTDARWDGFIYAAISLPLDDDTAHVRVG